MSRLVGYAGGLTGRDRRAHLEGLRRGRQAAQDLRPLTGKTDAVFSAATTADGTVTFPTAFLSIDSVTVSVVTPDATATYDQMTAKVTAYTTAAFDWRATNGSSISATAEVHYIVYGQKAA